MNFANIVIFSYNRACQLDALLRSLQNNIPQLRSCNTSVIWKADNKEFEDAYTKVSKKFPDIKMIAEKPGEFKQQTLDGIDENKTYTLFLVDDIIFKAPVNFGSNKLFGNLDNRNYLCVSLRLDRNIKHCYATNTPQKVPMTVPVWDWKRSEGDWGYPMSLDGNVYATSYIRKIVRSLEFQNPNQLEAKLDGFARANAMFVAGTMLCYEDGSRLLNVPANRVQNTFQNRSENSHDPKTLNDLYMSGKVIDISGMSEVKNTSCHWPLEYVFVEEVNANS